jgi:hypothetical protein
MTFDYRYLRKHFGWPEIPKPAWQRIKRFLDGKSEGFRVEHGDNVYEYGDLTFTLWRLSRLNAAECAVEELFGKCRVFV